MIRSMAFVTAAAAALTPTTANAFERPFAPAPETSVSGPIGADLVVAVSRGQNDNAASPAEPFELSPAAAALSCAYAVEGSAADALSLPQEAWRPQRIAWLEPG